MILEGFQGFLKILWDPSGLLTDFCGCLRILEDSLGFLKGFSGIFEDSL